MKVMICFFILCGFVGKDIFWPKLAQAKPKAVLSGSTLAIDEGITDEVLTAIGQMERSEKTIFQVRNIHSSEEYAKLFAAFPDITQLIIDSRELTSLEPVASLKKLQRITVNGAAIVDFSPLNGLPDLTRVEAYSTAMGPNLQWMSNLTKVSYLKIRAGQDLVSFEGIPTMPGLRSIEIHGASPADLTPLTALAALTSLTLQNSKLPDLTPLTGLPKLEKLNLYGSTIQDFSPLTGCSTLTELSIYATKGANFADIGKLTQLTNLQAGHTTLDDIAWITNITNLKVFRTFNEKITDYSPLTKLPLENLTIWSMKNPVGDLGFLAEIPTLKTLQLREVEGASNLETIGTLTNLVELEMTKTNAKGGGQEIPLESIKALPNLKEFVITKGVFTEEQLTGFAKPDIRIILR